MQKLIESVPLLLLIGLTPFFFYNEPNISQSIILAAISGLVGYRTYLDSLVTPDYAKLFTERLDAKDEEINSVMRHFEKELGNLKDSQNKFAIVKNQEEKINSFKW